MNFQRPSNDLHSVLAMNALPARAMNFQRPSNDLDSVLAMNALNAVNSNAVDIQVADMIKAGYFGPSQPPDVGAVSLQKLRQGDAAAVQSTAESLRHHGFIWLDFTGDVLDTNGTCMASALEEIGNFLAKHEHGGNSHAMEGHFSAAHKDGEPAKTAGVETSDSFGFYTLTALTYSNLILLLLHFHILPYIRMLLSRVQLTYVTLCMNIPKTQVSLIVLPVLSCSSL